MSGTRAPRKLPAWMTQQGSNKHGDIENKKSPPTLVFSGVINYCSTIGDMGLACETLISRADQSDELVLALDAEWPIHLGGSGKIALIQICADESSCYLFHISCMNSVVKIFKDLILHPKVKLVGNGVKNDIWKIGKDCNIHVAKLIASGCVIDLGDFANEVLHCAQTWSLDRLALHLLSVAVDKTASVRKSRWDLELSIEQQLYAATDAYVSLLIYNKLREKKRLSGKEF